jgi:hypothetical protein
LRLVDFGATNVPHLTVRAVVDTGGALVVVVAFTVTAAEEVLVIVLADTKEVGVGLGGRQ